MRTCYRYVGVFVLIMETDQVQMLAVLAQPRSVLISLVSPVIFPQKISEQSQSPRLARTISWQSDETLGHVTGLGDQALRFQGR